MSNLKNRRILLFLLGVISIVLLAGFLRFVVYERYERGFTNSKNVKRVTPGMDVEELLQIMGKPDTMLNSKQLTRIPEKTNIYYYENKPGTSAGIRIHVDSTERVIRILTIE